MREMSIGENYEGNMALIHSNISRFSRGTVALIQKCPSSLREKTSEIDLSGPAIVGLAVERVEICF